MKVDERTVRIVEMLIEGASGQRIAEELGVSRTAVWKMIKRLETFGFRIEAKRRVGYRIVEMPDLSPYRVFKICSDLSIVDDVYYYRTIGSTNDRAKEIGRPKVLVVAEEQTAGRGRYGRRWISERGGLYFSLTVPSLPIEDVPKLTLTAGVAVAEAIGGRLKWTNDVLLDGKKVCGILCELFGEVENPLVVVGIGINVNNPVPPYATSLSKHHGRTFDRGEVLERVLKNFERRYLELVSGGWRDIRRRWIELSDTLGKDVVVRTCGKEIRGRAVEIDEDGALVLEMDGRLEKVYSGECRIIHRI